MDTAVYGRGKEYGRKVLSLLMALAMVFSMVSSLTISASAASQSGRVLSSAYSKTGPREEFWIKGNLLSKKKVTLNVYLACGQGLTFPAEQKWYRENTRYNVWVLKKDNEHIQSYFYLKHGDTFKLPRGKRDWKVVIRPERIKEFPRSGYASSLWSYAFYSVNY